MVESLETQIFLHTLVSFFHTYPDLEITKIKFHTFPGFPYREGTLNYTLVLAHLT